MISDMVKKLRELSLQRIRSARAHTQKKKCQESEEMVFSGSGSGRTVSELADIIEGLSVEKTFKPFEAYQLCQLLSLLASNPVINLSNSEASLVEICPDVKVWKNDIWRHARRQFLEYLPVLILQLGIDFVMVSTIEHSSSLENFWAARLHSHEQVVQRQLLRQEKSTGRVAGPGRPMKATQFERIVPLLLGFAQQHHWEADTRRRVSTAIITLITLITPIRSICNRAEFFFSSTSCRWV